jgi:hypothetical protein
VPPLPSVPSVIKTRFLFQDGGDANVSATNYWLYTGGAPTSAAIAALAQDLNTAADGSFLALQGTTTRLLGVEAVDLASSSGSQAVTADGSDGTRTGSSLAGGTAALLNHHISRRYRGSRPKNFFPFGVSADLSTRQSWSTEFVTSMQSAWNSVLDEFLGSASGGTTIAEHVSISYYSGSRVVTSPTTGRARNVPIVRVTPLVDPITSSTANITPASQRRRNR